MVSKTMWEVDGVFAVEIPSHKESCWAEQGWDWGVPTWVELAQAILGNSIGQERVRYRTELVGRLLIIMSSYCHKKYRKHIKQRVGSRHCMEMSGSNSIGRLWAWDAQPMSARRDFICVGPMVYNGMDFTDYLCNFSLVSRGYVPIIALMNKLLFTEILAWLETVDLECVSHIDLQVCHLGLRVSWP